MARTTRDTDGPEDDQGWRATEIPVESLSRAAVDLLRLGAEAEVLAQTELRAEIARRAAAMAKPYADQSDW